MSKNRVIGKDWNKYNEELVKRGEILYININVHDGWGGMRMSVKVYYMREEHTEDRGGLRLLLDRTQKKGGIEQ